MSQVKVIYLKDGKGKPITGAAGQVQPDREYLMDEEIALKMEKKGQVKIVASISKTSSAPSKKSKED